MRPILVAISIGRLTEEICVSFACLRRSGQRYAFLVPEYYHLLTAASDSEAVTSSQTSRLQFCSPDVASLIKLARGVVGNQSSDN